MTPPFLKLLDYMKKYLPIILTAIVTASPMSLTCGIAYSQATPTPTPVARPSGAQVQQRPAAGFDMAEYGVEFQADPRLIIMMVALEAAGWDPVVSGRQPSAFRSQVRKDLATLDPELRSRLRAFYERTKLPAPATPADQLRHGRIPHIPFRGRRQCHRGLSKWRYRPGRENRHSRHRHQP